eukprot:Phypoly_transcript_08531.p1 GENE.Phypoly_transcript_08531~~Phypoly_transcript_08531.p1  ORF type:complete len:382 (+),score=91.86 Phypoly_transcript_08531:360-1505(+)
MAYQVHRTRSTQHASNTHSIAEEKMSVVQPKKRIEVGDCVIMFGSKDNAGAIKIKPGDIYNCRFGHFHHADLIGVEYGSKVFSKNKSGFMYALPVTAELWTNYLRHRTQILYSVDIAMVAYRLELKSGSIVIESGTGSGSLTTTLARTVSPNGHVYTFEFHAPRAEAAREDFAMTGLSGAVTVTNRDACKEGFLLPEKGLTLGTADGVFLDLPSPWEAIPHAKEVLKEGGMICSFSPCIEQVQKATDAMTKLQFIDIQTIECLLRPYDVRNNDMEHYNADDVDSLQISEKRLKTEDTQEKEGKVAKIKEEKDGEIKEEKEEQDQIKEEKEREEEEGESSTRTKTERGSKKRKERTFVKTLAVKPITDIRGHTGYLTFARRL